MHLPRFVITTAILALLLSPFHCYGQTEDEAMLAQAREHLSNRKYYFASTWLERLLRNHPATPQRKEALLLIIKVYDLSGRNEKAVPYVRALVKEFPKAAASLDPELLELAKNSDGDTSVPATSPPQPPSEEKKPAQTVTKALTTSVPGSPIPEQAHRPATPSPAASAAPIATKTTAAPPTPEPKVVTTLPTPSPQTPPPGKVSPSPELSHRTAIATGEGYYAMTDGITDRKRVESVVKTLKDSGLQPVVREDVNDIEVYRLVPACYDTVEAAQKGRLSLSGRIKDGFIFRDAESYCIAAASVKSETAAVQEQKRLAKKGQQVKIVKSRISLPVSQVFIGRFEQAREAEATVKILATHGIDAKVVKTANQK